VAYCRAGYSTDSNIREVGRAVSDVKKSVQSLKRDFENDLKTASKIAFPLSIIVNGRFAVGARDGFSYRAGERKMVGIATYFDIHAIGDNTEYVTFQSSAGNLILPLDMDTAADMIALAQQGHVVEISGNEETPSSASITARKPRGITIKRSKARITPISGR
jgi:hypothetical protein